MAKVKLKDLSLNNLEYGSGSASVQYDGHTRYIRITDIDDEGHLNDDVVSPKEINEKYLLKDGDILFARTGATVGKTYRYSKTAGNCIYAGYLIRFVPNPDIVYPDYIWYFTKSPQYREFIRNSMKVVAQPNINAKQYGDLEIEVPIKPSQEIIIKRLGEIRKIIDGRRHQLRTLDTLIKARFIELYNSSTLSEETNIESIVKRVKVGFVGTCEKYYTDESGIPMLRTGNITENGIDLSDLKFVTSEFHEKNLKSQIHTGDILIARHGSNGQANVYYGPEAQCLNAVIIVPDSNIASSVFLATLINSPMVRSQIDHTLVGSTQHVVNTKSIAALTVRIPDLATQHRFVEFVSQVDKSKVVVQKALDEAQLLFDSLMQQYFG